MAVSADWRTISGDEANEGKQQQLAMDYRNAAGPDGMGSLSCIGSLFANDRFTAKYVNYCFWQSACAGGCGWFPLSKGGLESVSFDTAAAYWSDCRWTWHHQLSRSALYAGDLRVVDHTVYAILGGDS